MPAIVIYAIGSGNKSNVPMIEDHFPVTISTVNTNDMLTIDIDTKPKANRSIIYGINVLTIPRAVPENPYKIKQFNNIFKSNKQKIVNCLIAVIYTTKLY